MAMKIARVEPGSEAEALGLGPGDELLSVDENELNDSLDYDFYTDSKSFHLKARVADGIREWDVQRTERGPFGCDFQTYLGDQKHSCSNHCMFCFIDQLPPGMRESLYFKDDDERLSFLFGNYITMTNMQDHEIDRIIKMHISPINISVHTTNPQLRVRMLANKRGGEVLKYLPRLVEGGIAVNCQLVLCRGINDGDELGQGCYCFVNGLVQTQVQKLQSHYPYIVVDNEAGMEHISRGILPMMEVAILVSDCSRRGVQAAGRIAKLMKELNFKPQKTGLIVNRVPDGKLDAGTLEEIRNQGLELLGVVPHDDQVYQYDCDGKPIIRLPKDSPVRSALGEIVKKLGL